MKVCYVKLKIWKKSKEVECQLPDFTYKNKSELKFIIYFFKWRNNLIIALRAN